MYFPYTSPFLSPFIPEKLHRVILQSSNFKSQLATYMKKLECIRLQSDFEVLLVSKKNSQHVCVRIYI